MVYPKKTCFGQLEVMLQHHFSDVATSLAADHLRFFLPKIEKNVGSLIFVQASASLV